MRKLALFLIVLISFQAQAQEITPENVLQIRKRTLRDDNPVGIPVGGFHLTPLVEFRALYDDNVLRTKQDQKSDLVSNIRPALALQSNWNRHALFLGGEGDFGFYKNETNQNYKDYGLLSSGQYDITDQTYVTGAVSHARRHQGRGFVEDAFDDSPVDYTTTSETLGFTRAPTRLKFKFFGTNTNTELTRDEDTGSLGSNSFIDRDRQSLRSTVAFEYTGGNEVFVSNLWDVTNYKLPNTGKRSSDGSDWRAGLNFNTFRNLNGSVYGGYLHRTYDGADDDTKEPYFGLMLAYNLTKLTKISLTLDKNFNETTIANAAGVIRTTHKIDIQQSITPLIVLNGVAGFDDLDYVGGLANDRETKFYYAGLSGDYKLSDQTALRLGYDYRQRSSNRSLDEYDTNRFLFSFIYSP